MRPFQVRSLRGQCSGRTSPSDITSIAALSRTVVSPTRAQGTLILVAVGHYDGSTSFLIGKKQETMHQPKIVDQSDQLDANCPSQSGRKSVVISISCFEPMESAPFDTVQYPFQVLLAVAHATGPQEILSISIDCRDQIPTVVVHSRRDLWLQANLVPLVHVELIPIRKSRTTSAYNVDYSWDAGCRGVSCAAALGQDVRRQTWAISFRPANHNRARGRAGKGRIVHDCERLDRELPLAFPPSVDGTQFRQNPRTCCTPLVPA